MKQIKKIFLEGESPALNKLLADESDNYNINYSGKSAKIVQISNYDTSASPGFLNEGKKESLQP